MYFDATVTVDPSQLTKIVPVKPTKIFAKLANVLSGGLTSKQQEHETFTAVAVLQQLNMVLRAVGVDDIVRIAKDDVVFYEDTEGQQGDLREALDEFVQRSADDDQQLFQTLTLVLQHSKSGVDYLIDLQINRTHAVGEHPIRLAINAFPAELNARGDENRVRTAMKDVFRTQEDYDAFTMKYVGLVESFVAEIEAAFNQHMHVDAVHTAVRRKIVRPNGLVGSRQDMLRSRADSASDPAFHDYHGHSDAFFYAWLWADHCHAHNIHCHDCVLMDESGKEHTSIGDVGVDAGSSQLMNVDTRLESTNSTQGAIAEVATEADVNLDAVSSGGDSGGGWFSSLMNSVGDMSFGGDSSCGGSSCGGSSCGGGCGGCGGGD